nr:ATP synthase F0 subunit 8 [Catillopecten margaritatus]
MVFHLAGVVFLMALIGFSLNQLCLVWWFILPSVPESYFSRFSEFNQTNRGWSW